MIQALAEKFGLSLERRALQPHCAAGELDGQRVIAAISSQGTLIDAVLRPPLDLGLSLSTRAFTFAPTFGRRIHLGDSSWDDELNATADEPDRARVLFRDSDLRGAVLMLNATNLGFEMTDHRVRILVGMNQFEDAGAALPKVARVANLVAAARRSVPPARELGEYAAALTRFTDEGQLRLEETPLLATGILRECHISVRFRRRRRGRFEASIAASAVEPGTPVGLLVRREGLIDRARTLLGGQDLRTGDAAFDPAFLVQANDPDRALAALDSDVRALLLELYPRFEEVTLSDSGLLLRGDAPHFGGDAFAASIDAACTVVRDIARASGAAFRGPYR